MSIKVEGVRELEATIAYAGKKEKTYRGKLKLMMWRALTIIEAAIIQNIRTNFNVGTGALLNAIPQSKRVREEGEELVGEIGAEGVPYASIQEFGGIIKPTRAKHLWIPDASIRGPDGVARMSPKEFFGFPKSKRVFVPLPKGGLMAGIKENAHTPIQPLFYLKDSVKLKGKPYIRPALEDTKAILEDKFGLFLEEHFEFK